MCYYDNSPKVSFFVFNSVKLTLTRIYVMAGGCMSLSRRKMQLSVQRRRMIRDTQRKIGTRRQTYFKQSLNQ